MDFFVKLSPRRPNFQETITAAEQATMAAHADFWRQHIREGRVVVFGPVFDPAGVYGMGVLRAETPDQAQAIVAADPARELMHFELFPMQAVTEP